MEFLAARVTAGDVAARAGIRVAEAETALNALAADTLGTLQVRSCVRHKRSRAQSTCCTHAGRAAGFSSVMHRNLLGIC